MFESGKNIFAQLVKSNDRVKQRKSFLINIYGHVLLANNTLNILCANNIWKKGSRVLDYYSQGIIPTKLYEFIVGTFSAMVRQKKRSCNATNRHDSKTDVKLERKRVLFLMLQLLLTYPSHISLVTIFKLLREKKVSQRKVLSSTAKVNPPQKNVFF